MSGETFETLLAPNLKCVKTMVRRELRNSAQAEDVMQEILLRAFVSRHQLRVHAKFRAWLWSIAVNEIRMFFRRNRALVSLDEFPSIDARDSSISPLARLEQIERHNWVCACIAALPERDARAIQLLDMEGKSIRDAAHSLEMSLSATKSIHFRARKRLARIIRARVRSRRPIRMLPKPEILASRLAA